MTPTRATKLTRRCVVVCVAGWLIATLVTALLQPPLTARGPFVDCYAFVALQLQTWRPIVAGFVLLLAVAAAWRHRRAAAAIFFAGVVGLVPELRHAWPARGDAMPGTAVRLMSLNNEGLVENVDAIRATIRTVDPDLIAFEQFAAGCGERLSHAIGDAYLSRLTFASPPFQGIALYSKRPLELKRAPDFHSDDHGRLLAATLDVDGRAVRIVVVHLTSPRNAERVAANRREVATLIERLGPVSAPTIVVGDCNFPTGAQQADALRAAGLVHVDDRAGWDPRWTWMPLAGLPMTRIDHVFVSRDLAVTNSRVLGDVGSDHRPICVDLIVPAAR